MSKADEINNIMYSMSYRDSVDFEADRQSYALDKRGTDWVLSGPQGQERLPNKTAVRKRLSKFRDVTEM